MSPKKKTSTAGARKKSVGDVVEEVAVLKIVSGVDSRPWFIIHPQRQPKLANGLDTLMAIALIFTALVTPFEVAFLESATKVDGLFVVNRLIDLIFCADVCVNFVMMYEVTSTVGISSEVAWEFRFSRIAARYLRGWFMLDVASLVPSIFDILTLFGGSFGPVKVLRVIKILKLAKLVRLVKSSRLISKWQTKVAISYANITLYSVFTVIFLLTHLFACLLSLITMSSDVKGADMWKGTFGYCACLEEPCTEEADIDCVAPFDMYVACIFWAMGVITGFAMEPEVGPYPPPNAVAALSQRFTRDECIILMVILFFGALMWVYVTAKFVDVISNSDPDQTEFRQTMDNLNRFISFNKLPPELAVRLRQYYHATKQMQAAKSRAHIVEQLSPALQEEVSLMLNKRWLRGAAFFNGLRMLVTEEDKEDMPPEVAAKVYGKDDNMKITLVKPVEDSFLAQVAMALNAAVFPPKEFPPLGRLYLIYGGGCSYKGKILGVGKTFGEIDVMLHKPPRVTQAMALSFLHVFYITGEALDEIAQAFPQSRKAMKTWAMYNGLKEYLLYNLSQERKKAAEDPNYDMYAPDPDEDEGGGGGTTKPSPRGIMTIPSSSGGASLEHKVTLKGPAAPMAIYVNFENGVPQVTPAEAAQDV